MLRKKQKPAPTRRNVQRQPSASVFSYHASRSSTDTVLGRGSEKPSTTVPRRRLQLSWLKYTPSLIAGVALLACLVYTSTLSTRPKIQTVGGQNGPTLVRNAGTYEDEAQAVLERSITNRSKLMIDTNKVARELREEFPELGEVTMILPLASRRPIIEVRPAHPALVVSAESGAFVVDEEGRAIVKVGEVESSIRDPLPIVQDESGLPIERGKGVLSKEIVAFITTVAAQLGQRKLPIQTLTLPTTANELHLRLEGKPYFVKFDIRGEGRLQAGTFIAVQEKLEAAHKTPAEYIDVRVPEKAFYR